MNPTTYTILVTILAGCGVFIVGFLTGYREASLQCDDEKEENKPSRVG